MSPYRTDPRMSGRHPFEIYTLFLAILTGFPTVLGIAPRPGSVNEALTPLIAAGWSWILVLGAFMALVGIYWHERATGLILEQLGLALTGVASIIYAACVLAVVGGGGFITVGLVGGFGVSCLRRYRDIQKDIDAVQAEETRRGRKP